MHGFAVGWCLKMQPSYCADGLGAAEVDLADGAIAPGLRERWLLGSEGIEKRATLVNEGLANQFDDVNDVARAKFCDHQNFFCA